MNQKELNLQFTSKNSRILSLGSLQLLCHNHFTFPIFHNVRNPVNRGRNVAPVPGVGGYELHLHYQQELYNIIYGPDCNWTGCDIQVMVELFNFIMALMMFSIVRASTGFN